jgi:putative tryptophan/tyrosine transport system substrate-binding protein
VTTSYDEAAPKRLGLLREILPNSTVMAILVDPNNPITANSETNLMRAAARSVGQRLEIVQASTAHDIDAAFAKLVNMRAGALVVSPQAVFATQAHQLITLATRHAMPTLYWRREFAEAGGLMSYGSNLADAMHVVGLYAGRILKGERAGDLPIQQPTKFELSSTSKPPKRLASRFPSPSSPAPTR